MSKFRCQRCDGVFTEAEFAGYGEEGALCKDCIDDWEDDETELAIYPADVLFSKLVFG